MVLSVTVVSFIAAFVLLLVSVFLAVLAQRIKKETGRPTALSSIAMITFLISLVGAIATTLMSGVKQGSVTPESAMGGMGSSMASSQGNFISVPKADSDRINVGALVDLEAQLAKNPEDVTIMEKLGRLYLIQRNYEKAFEMAHKVLNTKPDSLEANAQMGMILFAAQQIDAAEEHERRALSLNPRHADALYFMGMIQMHGRQNQEEAKKVWLEYQKVAPSDHFAQNIVQMFLSQI